LPLYTYAFFFAWFWYLSYYCPEQTVSDQLPKA
jgi:hypothetical protein